MANVNCSGNCNWILMVMIKKCKNNVHCCMFSVGCTKFTSRIISDSDPKKNFSMYLLKDGQMLRVTSDQKNRLAKKHFYLKAEMFVGCPMEDNCNGRMDWCI